MEAVVKMRTPLRSQITRLSNELSTLCLEVDPDLDEMRVKFDLMMEAHQSVKPLDEKILQFLVEKNASDVDIDEEMSKAEEYQVKVRMNYMKTMRVLNPNTVPVATLPNPGSTTNPVIQTKKKVTHMKYKLSLQRPGGGYRCTMMVRDQKVISNSIPRISRNSVKVFEELKQRKIWVTDVGDDCPPIEVLIGADVWAKLLTGNIQDLICGYTAIETHLGWTLSGEVKSAYMPERDSVSMMLLNMHIQANQRKKGPLSEQEIEEGMKKVVLDIQKEAYPDPEKIPVCNKP
ncbi:unnamed protein product, partial [Orchesella dallaii]